MMSSTAVINCVHYYDDHNISIIKFYSKNTRILQEFKKTKEDRSRRKMASAPGGRRACRVRAIYVIVHDAVLGEHGDLRVKHGGLTGPPPLTAFLTFISRQR